MRKQRKRAKKTVSPVLPRFTKLDDVIRHLSKIKNIKSRNNTLRQCNDRLIHDLSPRIRKQLKYISPLLSAKGNSSIKKFINRKTPLHVRRQMIRGQSGGGFGSWFTNLIGSIIPLLGAVL